MAKAKSEKVMSAVEMLAKLRAEKEAMLAKIATQEAEIAEKAKQEEAANLEKLKELLADTLETVQSLGINNAARDVIVSMLPAMLDVADMATARNLVATHAKHGTTAPASTATPSLNDGKYGRGQTIPEAEKENARALIREALANGKPLSEVAKATGIGYGSIFTWSKAIKAEMEAAKVATVPPAESTPSA